MNVTAPQPRGTSRVSVPCKDALRTVELQPSRLPSPEALDPGRPDLDGDIEIFWRGIDGKSMRRHTFERVRRIFHPHRAIFTSSCFALEDVLQMLRNTRKIVRPVEKEDASDEAKSKLSGRNVDSETRSWDVGNAHDGSKGWTYAAESKPVWFLEDVGHVPRAMQRSRDGTCVLVGFEGDPTKICAYKREDGCKEMEWNGGDKGSVLAIQERVDGCVWACTESLTLLRWRTNRQDPEQAINLHPDAQKQPQEEIVPKDQMRRYMPWELEEKIFVQWEEGYPIHVSIHCVVVRKKSKPLPCWAASFSREGHLLACAEPGNERPRVLVFDLPSAKLHQSIEGHEKGILSFAWHPLRSSILLSGSYDGTIRMWELKAAKCLKIFRGHAGGVRTISVDETATFMYSGSSDHTLKMWDLKLQACLRSFQGGHPSAVLDTKLHSGGDFLYSCGGGPLGGACIMLWETKGLHFTDSGKLVSSWIQINPNKAGAVTAMDLCEENQDFLVTGATDKSLACWRVVRWKASRNASFGKGFLA